MRTDEAGGAACMLSGPLPGAGLQRLATLTASALTRQQLTRQRLTQQQLTRQRAHPPAAHPPTHSPASMLTTDSRIFSTLCTGLHRSALLS